MNDNDPARCWEANAETWTTLARAGYDVYRDGLNTPAFFASLPVVRGLRGLDLGCGEGHNTRLLAGRGARVVGLDVAATFLRHARDVETEPVGLVRYLRADAAALPFASEAFDFATGFMSLMDMRDAAGAIGETYRVLRPGGFFQVSIEHPCFATPHRRQLRAPDGRTYAIEVGDYFRELQGEVSEWTFSAAPADVRQRVRPFRIPRYTRPLGSWLNLLANAGFVLEHCEEPRPDDATVARYPKLQDAQVVAYFLHLRARKPQAPALRATGVCR